MCPEQCGFPLTDTRAVIPADLGVDTIGALFGDVEVGVPNLSDTGRVRGELDVSLKWEMIADLFWQLSSYHSYDNRPPTVGAEKSDYGVVTSLGYDF